MNFGIKQARLLLVTGYCLLVAAAALAQADTFPQLDISGFKKWEYKKVEVTPQRNYFSGLTQLGGYYPTFTGGPWQERLQLRILGQLSENLSVTYDLEQQPEIPDRYNVKVKYNNSELTFGDFTATFSGNEFLSTSKFLNGFMVSGKENWYDVIAVPSAKLKSQTQNLTSQNGVNSKGPYNLGHGSIVEGSERIELNNVLLSRNLDYTIDYFEGKITFNRILTTLDQFQYSYEYTNILDLFFPSLSKRDFFGFQSRFKLNPEELSRPTPAPELVAETATETFPTASSQEGEMSASEALGQYQLEHSPVVNFSEQLTFMGTELKKNEDYIIRYDDGNVKLLTRFLPTPDSPLSIAYKYYATSSEAESLQGIGSRGPYQLKNKNIVLASERIEVDAKLFVRDLDYTINNDTGGLTFSIAVSSTSQIKATYRYGVTSQPQLPPSKFPKELSLGITYLKESAQKSAGTAHATIIESTTGQNIINNNYLWYLNNKPVVPTSESAATLVVNVDGHNLTWEVDYTIPLTNTTGGTVTVTPEAALAYVNDRSDTSDGYATGTIKFLTPQTITATSQVSVTYTYYKGVVGKYSGVGDGTQGPYYLRNIRNIVPGSETIQVWEQGSSVITTFTRNSSFSADAGDNGYAINYTADNPSVTFNTALSTTKNFQIIYQYIPPQAFEGGDIAQAAYGFDSSYKIGDIFKVETSYAKSETDQVYIAESTIESFSGDGSKTYNLSFARSIGKDIIEGSEKVFVNNNLLNKDIDYYVSYTNPNQQITFYYITPATADAIAIEYKYQSQSGLVVGQEKKEGSAYRLGAQTSLFGDKLQISGSTKHIDFDFTPLGGTQIGLGSRYKEYNIRLAPGAHDLSANYSYKENNTPIGSSRSTFLNSFDNNVSLSFNPKGLALVNFNYRNYQTLDDLALTTTSHSSDTLQNSYALSLTPTEWQRGVMRFNQKYDLQKTLSQTDAKRDSASFTETDLNFQHANANLSFTDRISLGFDYQKSEPQTVSLTATTEGTAEALSAHSRSTDLSYNLSIDLTPGFLQRWLARFSRLDHQGVTLTRNFLTTNEVETLRNETYHMDFVPFSILNTSLDHNRQESSSVIIGGTNPLTERSSANVQLTPKEWISCGWNGSQSDSIPDSGASKRTTGLANTYNVDWKPISFERVGLSSWITLAENLQTAPSGTYEGIRTETNSLAQSFSLSLVPHPNAPVTLGLILETYKNKNNNPDTISQINTETKNQTINAGITVTPNPIISISSTYNLKITKIIHDLRLTPQERPKTIIDSKITYQVFDWGILIYDREDEDNRGEVQNGSVADLHIKKQTQTYSLNINLPVDNPVLSSFSFIASIRSVDYWNLANASGNDDFNATLASFEGSLNF